MKIIPIFFVLLIFSMGLIPAHAEIIQLITKNGNVINVEVPTDSSSSDALIPNSAAQNATSVLNGFGYTANIVTIEEDGRIIYGYNTIGVDKPITPYTPTDSQSNFATIVLDTDTKNTYTILEFAREYSFDGSNLIDVTVPPLNILGYSETRDIIGTNTISINNGIVVSGTGTSIIKLNDYASNRIILTGDVDAGSVKLITPASVDLMSTAYGVNGFSIPVSLPAAVGADSTHYATASWTTYWTMRTQSCAGPVNGYYYVATSLSPQSSNNVVSLTIAETNNGDHALITSLSGYTATAPADTGGAVWQWCQQWTNNGIQGGSVSAVTLALYDTLPAYTKLQYTNDFVEDYTFPAEQTYLYVQPNGGTISILGQQVTGTPELKITNLPPNIPYQISKDGWVGISGVTSASGTITLSEDEVTFEGFTTEGGLLHLYPDSLTYVGHFTTIALDKVNNKSFHITDGADQIYVPAAYVKLPIPLDVEINKIKVGTVTFDYLTGNYTAGDSVFVPIIPKMKTLDLTLNDVNAVINIADITNQAQSKLLSSRTDSTTLYATGSAIESIEVGVTNTAVAIATHTGKMNAVVAATVSGEAEFTINSDYTGSYEQTYDMCQAAMVAYGVSNGCVQHGYPTDGLIMAALVAGQAALDSQLAGHKAALEAAIIAQGPLTVTVTVFKNGIYENTFEIFDNLNPQFTAASSLGLVSVQNAKVVYDTTSGSKPITIEVAAGDYVEFVVHAGLVVSGIPSPIDLDDAKIAGFASGTVNLHYGTVTASMG